MEISRGSVARGRDFESAAEGGGRGGSGQVGAAGVGGSPGILGQDRKTV